MTSMVAMGVSPWPPLHGFVVRWTVAGERRIKDALEKGQPKKNKSTRCFRSLWRVTQQASGCLHPFSCPVMERPSDKYLSGRPFFIPHTNAAGRRLGLFLGNQCHSSGYVRGVVVQDFERVAVEDGDDGVGEVLCEYGWEGRNEET